MVIPRSLDISEPVPSPLDTLPDLLRGREADQWDEGLGSRETWQDHRRRVDPDRSHGLLEERQLILGFLSPVRVRRRFNLNGYLPQDPLPNHRCVPLSGGALVD